MRQNLIVLYLFENLSSVPSYNFIRQYSTKNAFTSAVKESYTILAQYCRRDWWSILCLKY